MYTDQRFHAVLWLALCALVSLQIVSCHLESDDGDEPPAATFPETSSQESGGRSQGAADEARGPLTVRSPLYVAEIDRDAKCCRRITYTVTAADLGEVHDKRRYYTPPELRDALLESGDYAGSGYDRGHLRALALSAGSEHVDDVNSMAVIVPMTPAVNREQFREVERRIAELVEDGPVAVEIVCEFKTDAQLPAADEPHQVPSAFVISITPGTIDNAASETLTIDNQEAEADPEAFNRDPAGEGGVDESQQSDTDTETGPELPHQQPPAVKADQSPDFIPPQILDDPVNRDPAGERGAAMRGEGSRAMRPEPAILRSPAEIMGDVGPDRVMLFNADWCPACVADQPKREAALAALQRKGWRVGEQPEDQFQIVDVDASDLDERLGIDAVPAYVKVEDGRIVRQFRRGCSEPLDAWALGRLYTGRDQRPEPKRAPVTAATTGQYPLRGNWWSVDGQWNAIKAVLIAHLTGGEHRGKFDRDWLQSLSRAELHSLHSDDHEGRLQRRHVRPPAASTPAVRSSCPSCPVRRPATSRNVRRRFRRWR